MTTPSRFTPRKLFLISFTILFVELSAIRWLNASVDVLAYFNNFILISCFLGLGLGCLLAPRQVDLIKGFAPALLVLVAAVVVLDRFGLDLSYDGDHVFAEEASYYQTGVLNLSVAALAGFFINVAFFVLLGQELGKQLRAMDDPLRAYAWDIAGSFTGVVIYTALAWMQTPPHVWYGLAAVLLLVFLGRNRPWIAVSVVLVVAALTLMRSTYEGAHWSPYYKVEAEAFLDDPAANPGYRILVDNVRIQDALAFDADHADSPVVQYWTPYYQLPYHYATPRRVLILGAGAGNEAVMAHYADAEVVHAVEIDPVIAGFGLDLHPVRPYTLPGVVSFVDDARSYVANCDERYDLILMSALDSHKQIAGMSSLRLESFTYTVEAFRQMKELLADGGMFCLNVGTYRPWIGDRVYWTLTEAFGEEPVRLVSDGIAGVSVSYVYAPEGALDRNLLVGAITPERAPPLPRPASVLLATDDWPHLYLEGRRIPGFYLAILGTMMLVSVLLVVRTEPSVLRPNLHFFMLGAGFMLLQTRSITQVALLFGSTWGVNAVVFAAILGTIFIGNLLVMKRWTPPRRVSYALLMATLVAGFFFPFEPLLDLAVPLRLAAAGVAVGLPILWAALIFSTSFRDETQVDRAFGSNLLGVVFGGGLEYASIYGGLDVLYLVALGIYLVSAICAPRRVVASV